VPAIPAAVTAASAPSRAGAARRRRAGGAASTSTAGGVDSQDSVMLASLEGVRRPSSRSAVYTHRRRASRPFARTGLDGAPQAGASGGAEASTRRDTASLSARPRAQTVELGGDVGEVARGVVAAAVVAASASTSASRATRPLEAERHRLHPRQQGVARPAQPVADLDPVAHRAGRALDLLPQLGGRARDGPAPTAGRPRRPAAGPRPGPSADSTAVTCAPTRPERQQRVVGAVGALRTAVPVGPGGAVSAMSSSAVTARSACSNQRPATDPARRPDRGRPAPAAAAARGAAARR
jgi:hypothetical protein